MESYLYGMAPIQPIFCTRKRTKGNFMQISKYLFANKYKFMLIFFCAVIILFSFFIQINPCGTYYSELCESLHDGSVGFFVLTRNNIFYAINYDTDNININILVRGTWKKSKNGIQIYTNDNLSFHIKTYWWGCKIYTEENDVIYGYRAFYIGM